MIYTVTLNPSVDHTLTVERFRVGGTFKATRSERLPAGKGINAARVAATLGEPVAALGLVGQDAMPAFAAALAEQGIGNRLLAVPGATRISVTILDPVDRTETHLREPGVELSREALDRIAGHLDQVSGQDWVIFAGSLPPGLPADTYQDLIRRCADRGAKAVLDANGPPLLSGVTSPPTLLKVNLFELRMLVRMKHPDKHPDPAWQRVHSQVAETGERVWDPSPAQILAALRDLQAGGVSMVIVTLGERGVIGLDADGNAWSAATHLDRPVVDAVGSGDALGAGCVVALARGASFAEALRLGVACGAANTLVAGAGRCRKADIERLAVHATVVSLADRTDRGPACT